MTNSKKVFQFSVSLFLIGLVFAFWVLIKPKLENITKNDVSLENDQTKVRLLFGGDLMFDRHIRLAGQNLGYDFVFSDLKELFFDYDLVIANLEGPITDNASVSLGTMPGTPQNFIFTFDPQVAGLLADHNIRIVCLGNNHILNFGQKGLDSTKQYLTA
ncbi:MAG: CapA family protein, partial [Candidatus Shapirobacteria bacterium]|nr:CapA family protein [Candidatus Shapirobacteria bacterium]